MESLIRMIGGVALVFMAQRMVRWTIRVELGRVGLNPPRRNPTQAEMRQVIALEAEGKFYSAERLFRKLTNQG